MVRLSPSCEVSRRPDPEEDDDELSSLRFLAIRVFTFLSALIVIADILGRLFRDNTFHADPTMTGLVFGTLLSLLGLEGIQRLLNRKGDDD